MNTSIVSKKIELTQGMKDHIEAIIEQFNKYSLEILSVKTIVGESKTSKKQGVEVEFTIVLPKKDTIVIKQSDKDFYAACDLAVDRAKKVLRRLHDRLKNNHPINQEKTQEPTIYSDDDEIVPIDLDLYKPIEPAQALDELKSSTAVFRVFKDIDLKTRVLYKRKDGKFGLY